MKRYHSIKDSRIRRKRFKIAKKYGYDPVNNKRYNFDSELHWLGSCGNKHCWLCVATQTEKKKVLKPRDKREKERFDYQLIEFKNKEYFDLVDEDWYWSNFESDGHMNQEDYDFIESYLKKAA